MLRTSPLCLAFALVSACCFQVPILFGQEPNAEVKVELLDAGKSPRKELRFSPKQGDTQLSVMTMNMSQSVKAAGRSVPTPKIPAQKISMDIETTSVSENGDIDYTFKYSNFDVVDDPENPSPSAENMRAMFKPMIGSSGKGTITNRGIAKVAEYEIPADLSAQLKVALEGMTDSIKQMSSPVPAEPVGLGAKWKTTQSLVANGMKVTQTIEHEVVELNESGFSTKTTINQVAEPQEIKSPMMPPGATIKLDSLKTSGEGTGVYKFNSLFPIKSTSKVHSDVAMSISIAGQNQKMDTVIDIDMELQNR